MALAVIAMAVLGTLFWAMCIVDRVPAGDLRERIERELPRGSTIADINRFLEREDVGYSEPGPARPWSVLRDRGVDSDTTVISAIYRNAGPRWTFVGDEFIQVFFVLGADLRLEEIIFVPGSTFL